MVVIALPGMHRRILTYLYFLGSSALAAAGAGVLAGFEAVSDISGLLIAVRPPWPS